MVDSDSPDACGMCYGTGKVAQGPWGSRPPKTMCPDCGGSGLKRQKEIAEIFLDRLIDLVSRVKLGMKCHIKIGRDEEIPNGRFYFQIQCKRIDVITKIEDWGYGGKAYLSPHMTDSELFQIMFGLYKGYWEHEARENFEIDGVRPFGPHISTEALISVARKVDIRSAKHVEDRNV